MAGGGRPPTTFPCCTRQSRGWPAFAGHDTRGACHLGRTSMLPPVRIRQQHPPRRGLPGFGCVMSAVKRRAGPRPIRVLSVYPFCICVESFLLCRVPHRCRTGSNPVWRPGLAMCLMVHADLSRRRVPCFGGGRLSAVVSGATGPRGRGSARRSSRCQGIRRGQRRPDGRSRREQSALKCPATFPLPPVGAVIRGPPAHRAVGGGLVQCGRGRPSQDGYSRRFVD